METEDVVASDSGAEREPEANGKCFVSFVADDLMRARLRVASYRRGMTVSAFIRKSMDGVLAEEARVDWRGKLGAGS